MGDSLTRDNAADRRRRTIEAPNGARVVMPHGTTDAQLLDQLLRWYYLPFWEQETKILIEMPLTLKITKKTVERLTAKPMAFATWASTVLHG